MPTTKKTNKYKKLPPQNRLREIKLAIARLNNNASSSNTDEINKMIENYIIRTRNWLRFRSRSSDMRRMELDYVGFIVETKNDNPQKRITSFKEKPTTTSDHLLDDVTSKKFHHISIEGIIWVGDASAGSMHASYPYKEVWGSSDWCKSIPETYRTLMTSIEDFLFGDLAGVCADERIMRKR